MKKNQKAFGGKLLGGVLLAPQSITILRRLAALGSYGLTTQEVASRLLEQAITERFVEPLRIRPSPERRRAGRGQRSGN